MNRNLIIRLMLLACIALCFGCGASAPITEMDPVTLDIEPARTVQEQIETPNGDRLPCTIRFPANYDPSKKVPLVVALHYGYEGGSPELWTGG